VVTHIGSDTYTYEAHIKPGSPIIDLSALAATNTGGLGWSYVSTSPATVTIDGTDPVTITGSTTTVRVVANASAQITLDNATINFGAFSADRKALSITGSGTTVVLTLKGGTTNTLTGRSQTTHGGGIALHVDTGATVQIEGTGKLLASVTSAGNHDYDGIGIGNSAAAPYGGNITIKSGAIEATGQRNGPAIGGGGTTSTYSGNIQILGGNVTAKGGPGANASIGIIGGNIYSGAVTIGGNAVVTVPSTGSLYCIGANTNAGSTLTINENALLLMTIATGGTYFKLQNGSVTLNQGIVKYGNNYHVFGTSPRLLNYALTVGTGQVMDFVGISPTGFTLSGTGVPNISLTTTNGAGQTLMVGNGGSLTNSGGTIHKRTGVINTESDGTYSGIGGTED
jgi:hypothetical protein